MNDSLSRRQFVFSSTAASLALGVSGCGYLLYSERKGRSGGRIDAPILVVDLLWLLPGIIPGAICLIVDFTTGCIYRDGGRVEARPERQRGPQVAEANVDVDGETVAQGNVTPEGTIELSWSSVVEESALRTSGRLRLRRPDGSTAEAFVRDLV